MYVNHASSSKVQVLIARWWVPVVVRGNPQYFPRLSFVDVEGVVEGLRFAVVSLASNDGGRWLCCLEGVLRLWALTLKAILSPLAH